MDLRQYRFKDVRGHSTLTGLPQPLTASQPFVAGKPDVLQPADDPLVTSVKAL